MRVASLTFVSPLMSCVDWKSIWLITSAKYGMSELPPPFAGSSQRICQPPQPLRGYQLEYMPGGASRLSGEASAEFACEPSPKRMRGDDDVVDVAVGGGDVAVADGGRVVGVAVAVGTCVAVAVGVGGRLVAVAVGVGVGVSVGMLVDVGVGVSVLVGAMDGVGIAVLVAVG